MHQSRPPFFFLVVLSFLNFVFLDSWFFGFLNSMFWSLQVCHDRADNTEEWRLQFRSCTFRAFDRKKASRPYNAQRTTESGYLGEFLLMLLLLFFFFFFTIILNSDSDCKPLLLQATPRLSEDKVKQCVDPKLNNDYPAKAIAKVFSLSLLASVSNYQNYVWFLRIKLWFFFHSFFSPLFFFPLYLLSNFSEVKSWVWTATWKWKRKHINLLHFSFICFNVVFGNVSDGSSCRTLCSVWSRLQAKHDHCCEGSSATSQSKTSRPWF